MSRSLEEHIRLAHPGQSISKLLATVESFRLVTDTLPQERRADQSRVHPQFRFDLQGQPLLTKDGVPRWPKPSSKNLRTRQDDRNMDIYNPDDV